MGEVKEQRGQGNVQDAVNTEVGARLGERQASGQHGEDGGEGMEGVGGGVGDRVGVWGV